MPINNITYKLIRDMKTAGILPGRPYVLELGESNWYGDLSIEKLERDIDEFIDHQETRETLRAGCQSCRAMLSETPPQYEALWELSHIFYRVFLDYEDYHAIDLGGSGNAMKLDLNHEIKLDRQYDIVIDFGTAEHVFNVYQLFKTVHEVTKPGGFIFHGLPFHGWVDHGFFNFQPTFFLDLAAANNYQIKILVYRNVETNQVIPIQNREQIGQTFKSVQLNGSGSLFVAYQKADTESDFKIPMQGYYAGSVSDSVRTAWYENR